MKSYKLDVLRRKLNKLAQELKSASAANELEKIDNHLKEVILLEQEVEAKE